jgi:hypothetical protein
MVLQLIMPGLYQEITVKIMGLPFIKGKDVYAPVMMWGDPKKFEFEMKITKTIWHGIYAHLKELEDDPLNGFMELEKFEIDESLSFLKDRILTIKGMPDLNRKFVTKNGKVEYPKIFSVQFQSDLEDAERAGKEAYKEAVFAYVINRESSRECRLANTRAAMNAIAKKENKELEKEEKKKEKAEKKIEKEVEWAKIKREKEDKEEKKQKKLGSCCGWPQEIKNG